MTSAKDQPTEEYKLIAADMWPIYNFSNASKRYAKFLERGRLPLKSFIEGILLYEKVYVPTQDFLSLTILVGVLGERAVLDLLAADRLKFLRVNGSLAYVGNGAGISHISITTPEGEPDSFCAPIESAVNWALNGLLDKPKDPLLPLLVVAATQELDLKSITEDVKHETYMDVLKSPYLRNRFSLRNRDLNRLSGIGPKGVRIYGGPSDESWEGDEIDMLMALAATNIELRLAQSINCSDASTASPIGHLIKAKGERSLESLNIGQSFAALREIAGIPDVGEGVLENQLSIPQIIKLTQTRNSIQFRQWFHENCRENPVATAREYVSLLRDVPNVQSLPAKIMRFITTTALGAIPVVGQAVGALAGVVDSFFIEKWLRGNSPKYFIDDIRQFQGEPKEQPKVRKEQGKVGRNKPCPCGSGKKYKKCCG